MAACKSQPRGAGLASDDVVVLPSTPSSLHQTPDSLQVSADKLSADAAREWREQNIKRRPVPVAEPVDELVQTMRRAAVFEYLDTVPRDVIAAQYFLEAGADGHAFLHLQRVVLAVKEAARTFNEIRKGEQS